MLYGILTEKPSAARSFAKALGGMSGTFDEKDYVITNAAGHLYEIDSPENMVPSDLRNKYKNWSLDNLPWDERDFDWSMVPTKDTSRVLSQIKSTLSGCEFIVLAGDVDPSGEGGGISINIIQELGLLNKKFCRMYFDDESMPSIQKAFKTMKPIPDILHHDEYLMYLYRSRWDFLSMQFTRICKCLTGKLLREGRLKSSMVVLVGDQLKAVSEYKKIPFYEWRFRDENGIVYSNPNEPRFPSKEQLLSGYVSSDVVVDGTEKKHKAPPKFMDLAALSAVMESKYGVEPSVTLKTYQKMYEAQIVSYPRTEDKTITPEQFNDLLPKVDDIAAVIGVDHKLLTYRSPRPSHVKTGGAHGANRPGMNVPKSLSDLQSYGRGACEIYETLARNYLATIASDCMYDRQTGHLADYPDFTGSATRITSPGWKLIFGESDEDEELSMDAPLLGTKADPFVFEGFPPKPSAPTTKWLMKQLEKHEVGTGATRTKTFADITNVKDKNGNDVSFFHSKRGRLTFSEFGDMSYMLLPGTHIGSLDLTEQVWKNMKDAGKGADISKMLHDVQRLVSEDIVTMKKNLPAVQAKYPDAKPGSATGGGYVKKEKISGKYKGKTEVSFNVEWGGHRFTDDEIAHLLAGDQISFQAVSAAGKPYVAKGVLAQQTYRGTKFWGFKADFGKK